MNDIKRCIISELADNYHSWKRTKMSYYEGRVAALSHILTMCYIQEGQLKKYDSMMKFRETFYNIRYGG